MVIREEPPSPPLSISKKFITISGKKLPPPPRKVIVERLAPLPSRPQPIIVERWLPYPDQTKRKVVFNREQNDAKIPDSKEKNLIIQWQSPDVVVRKEVKYLGVIRANPVEYLQRFGDSLRSSEKLPQFVLDIETPDDICLAADYKHNLIHELEGQVEALKLIDMDMEGLAEYKSQLNKLGITLNERALIYDEHESVTPESGRGSLSENIY